MNVKTVIKSVMSLEWRYTFFKMYQKVCKISIFKCYTEVYL